MPKITKVAVETSQLFFLIGICTRNRDPLLQRLLDSINQQIGVGHYKVEILIVDNNNSQTVTRSTVGRLNRFPIHVCHEPKPGLCNARNRLFDDADRLGADWVIGVDDDEWVANDWLAKWIEGISQGLSPILIGKMDLVHSPGGSILRTRRQYKTPIAGRPATLFGTCNYAISREVFSVEEGRGMRFDPAFNTSGGEDGEFMLRAKRQFDIIPFGWPHSKAYEERSDRRSQLSYSLTRSVQDRINALAIARLHRRLGLMKGALPFGLLVIKRTNQSVVFGVGCFVLGIIQFPLSPYNGGKTIGRSLEHLAQAYAVIPFLLSHSKAMYGQ